MSFLGWPAETRPIEGRRRNGRRKLAADLLALFGRSFPDITYDLLWESLTINAQAWRLGSARRVTIYGGLVRHPAITRPGLALSIAHETGHHLGGAPPDPAMRWMTWQGQADYWAARTAMPIIFGSRARAMTLRGARQILRLHEALIHQLDDEPDLSARCRYCIFVAGASGLEIPPCNQAEYLRACQQYH